MRRVLLKIHLYGGLICFWYLIILGTSSLDFNHRFPFMQGDLETELWTHTFPVAEGMEDNNALSAAIRDSLGLIGWPLPWETWRDTTGMFHFALQHPGKRYVIDYDLTDGTAKVSETPRSSWRIFNSLHGMGPVPNSGFMHLWKWYSRFTAVLVLFSVCSGIYLWYRGRREKQSGWYVLVISLALSLFWMVQLYFLG